MQPRDRRDQAEAEAGARPRPARLQPHEALQHALAVGGGNAGAAVGDRDAHLAAVRRSDTATLQVRSPIGPPVLADGRT